ncbi:glutathione-independent formaldehyde dehydrogenase [Aspergillus ibericus CBS 121593]|uniref:Alcohol dehydrogenase n=1 Tax=Aspergillus ibericus CBS 121593 TaxID=1448316 RepID=A0A395GLU6_9EURO|nr:alcohol dehydrogenase [Aspergillus ibericus CBS 121593]RAK96475.1 alcohol dehydrogenase [Aspergillus ibericus CBS 121593]
MPLNTTLTATMRAVAWFGQPYNVSVIDMPVPSIINQTDAVIRITTSAICGSDLHFYHGYTGAADVPWGLGHEAVGYVSEVGEAVSSLKVGDYVIIPDNAHDGHYGQNHPLAFGSGSPDYGGLQAEYARVPFADMSLIPIPFNNSTGNATKELDYLMISDIFTTGWQALTYSGFQPGDTVAVFGAGPVGLMAAYSAILRGASRVYSVDQVPSRLQLASSIGAIPISFNTSDPVDQIVSREPNGVTRALDCVGFEAVNATGHRTDGIVPRNLLSVAAQQGGIAIAGVYTGGGNSTRGAPFADQIPAQVPFSVASLWEKELTVGSGIVLPLEHAQALVDLVAADRATPSFVISSVIDIEQAPEYYRRYSDHLEHKIVIRFP